MLWKFNRFLPEKPCQAGIVAKTLLLMLIEFRLRAALYLTGDFPSLKAWSVAKSIIALTQGRQTQWRFSPRSPQIVLFRADPLRPIAVLAKAAVPPTTNNGKSACGEVFPRA